MVTQFVAMPQSPAVVAMAQPQQVRFCVCVGDLWGLWGKCTALTVYAGADFWGPWKNYESRPTFGQFSGLWENFGALFSGSGFRVHGKTKEVGLHLGCFQVYGKT